MARKKQLSRKQLAVICDMFSGELDEQAVLARHKVSRNLYNRWLSDRLFVEEFERRIEQLRRQSELVIARYSVVAAAKLVALTESEKEETARRACLDILSLPLSAAKRPEQSTETQVADSAGPGPAQQLTPETASKLLAALAEAQQQPENS